MTPLAVTPHKRYALSVKDAAAYLDLPVWRTYQLAGAQQIAYLRVGRLLRFAVEDLVAWQQRQVTPAVPVIKAPAFVPPAIHDTTVDDLLPPGYVRRFS